MSLVRKDLKQFIVDGGMRLYKQGLTVGTWGNLSIRGPGTNLFYIKPSGMPYTEIRVGDIVVMDEKTEIMEGHRKPSIEFNFLVKILSNWLETGLSIANMHYRGPKSSPTTWLRAWQIEMP